MSTLDLKPVERSMIAGDKLFGRVALVTGGSRGIGAAICRSLVSQGASVAAGYSANRDRAEQFLKELESDFGADVHATLHQGNVSKPEDCRRVIGEVLEQHGRLDILVNNAGITIDKMAAKMTVDDWNTVLAVNLSGSFYMAQPALEHMVERGTGRIIFVSSVIGEHGNVGQANYAASKAGMIGLTKALAKEAAFILKRADRARRRRRRHHGEHSHTGLRGDGNARARSAEDPGQDPGADPDAPVLSSGRGRTSGPFPRRRRLGVHHRPGLGGQRRPGHVAARGLKTRLALDTPSA